VEGEEDFLSFLIGENKSSFYTLHQNEESQEVFSF